MDDQKCGREVFVTFFGRAPSGFYDFLGKWVDILTDVFLPSLQFGGAFFLKGGEWLQRFEGNLCTV